MAPDARWLIALLGVAAAVAVAPAIAAPGAADTIPANAVVRVGDTSIARSTFKRWFHVAAASNPATLSSRQAYGPPDFVPCIKHKRKVSPRGRGRARPSTAQLRTQCKQEYEGLRDQVLQFLILEKWVKGEAAELGVVVTEKELDAEFQKALRDTFPRESDFRRFLKQSGMTVADARFQVAFNTRYTKLRELAIAGAAPVTDADVAAFYAEHADDLAEPETRDLRVVLTKTRARADAARRAIERGQTWTRVAKKYSIDDASRARGGRLKGVAEGSQEKAFDDAIFRAPKGKTRGPVKTRFGYYIFKVVKITPATQPTLEEATPAIEQELTAKRQMEADDAFNRDLRAKWKARTFCRAGYVMDQCSNAPRTGTATVEG